MGECVPNYKDAVWAYFRYDPSAPLAAVIAALFGITTVLHLAQLIRTRTWYLMALVIGGLCELIGYIARAINASEEAGCWTLGPFIVSSLLILLGPPLVAASIYMILGRIILLTDGEAYAFIRRTWLTKIFVVGDVFSLLLQSSGGGMMAADDVNMVHTGENLIVAGLFVQLAFFGCFVVVAGLFHRRMARAPTFKANLPDVRWKTYLTTLYVTSSLILVRSIFRVIEYIAGNDGPLMRTEVYLYVFDSLLMLIVFYWMNWFHPSEIGLLLRGERPITNGMQLVTMKSRGKQGQESLASAPSSEDR